MLNGVHLSHVPTGRFSRVVEFLTAARVRPWKWGTDDCCMTPADWVLAETGIDPAAEFRGAYHDEESCRRAIQEAGGFVQAVGYAMDAAGFERTQSPGMGDVGIVTAPIELRDTMPVVGAVGAIRCGRMWVCRSLRGLKYREFPLITAWRV